MAQEAAALFNFLDGSWERVCQSLPGDEQLFVIRDAASRLRWSGRLRDAGTASGEVSRGGAGVAQAPDRQSVSGP
jgi:hypothetical protein